ncbi:MAG: hypothetical protein J7L82_03515 [Staphylothermus sp.]|nr:hypothetical protein [Staphylothermus sp.]
MHRRIYRVKIPKCLDVVIYDDIDKILKLLDFIMENIVCDKNYKLYIHALKQVGNELVDEKLILSTRLGEFREDMLSLHVQS